jgi:hypothetical protein
MPNIQPVPNRCNQHKGIAELMMRIVSVVQFPAHPIIPRKAAFAKNSFHIAQNAFVDEHPKVIEMADGDDVKAKTNFACYEIVSK